MSNYSEERKQHVLGELTSLGVATLIIEYSGSGDSGAVDSIYAYKTGESYESGSGHEIDSLVPINAPPDEIAIKVSNKLLDQEEGPLREELENLAYAMLEHVNASDWCNNDGGGGVITVHVEEDFADPDEHPAGHIQIEHYYNVTEQVSEAYEL